MYWCDAGTCHASCAGLGTAHGPWTTRPRAWGDVAGGWRRAAPRSPWLRARRRRSCCSSPTSRPRGRSPAGGWTRGAGGSAPRWGPPSHPHARRWARAAAPGSVRGGGEEPVPAPRASGTQGERGDGRFAVTMRSAEMAAAEPGGFHSQHGEAAARARWSELRG